MGTMIVTDVGKQKIHDGTLDWNNLKAELFTSPPAVDEETVYGDLLIADFSGHAATDADYGAGDINGAGKSEKVMTEITMQHNGGGTANVCVGWGISDFSSGGLIFVKLFDEGDKSFAVEGDFVDLNHTITLDQV